MTTSDEKILKFLPVKIYLPLFAYGLFKPDQLCFFRIKEFVEKYDDGIVEGVLKERDGIPLLVKYNDAFVKGKIIYFNKGKEKDAYTRIAQIEPNKLYKWETIKVNDDITANILIGRSEEKGSVNYDYNEWDGNKDPLLKYAVDEIRIIYENNTEFDKDYKSFFRIQMAYILLWSAIERYASLKYHLGKDVIYKIKQIAKEECFVSSLKKHFTNERIVFDSADLKKYTLNPDNPENSLLYYYQIRSNSVHRGKSISIDFRKLRYSLGELINIFEDLLKDSLMKND